MAYISRDPFARTELHSERVRLRWINPPQYDKPSQCCAWCGGVKKTRANHPYLNQYRIEHDGGRVDEASELFCSVSCFRDYNS